MNTKEILQQLKAVFYPSEVIETELSEEVKETEVVAEEVELAEANADSAEDSPAPMVEEEPKVEYATKVELQEFARTFLELLEAMQKQTETTPEVPQELSSDEVELSTDVEEINHSPELEVEKKVSLNVGNRNANTIQSRIYKTLFN
jgi:hypothetical protein